MSNLRKARQSLEVNAYREASTLALIVIAESLEKLATEPEPTVLEVREDDTAAKIQALESQVQKLSEFLGSHFEQHGLGAQ